MTNEEALEIIGKAQLSSKYTSTEVFQVKRAFQHIKSVLEQQPKPGHWISHNEHCEKLGVKPSGLGAYVWCSNCDCGIDVEEFHRNHYNFCPNCGADMRESEE